MKEKLETRAIQIRFPTALYRELKKRTKTSRRSLNGETVASLERFLELDRQIHQIRLEKEGKC